MSEYKYLFGPVPSRRLGISLGVDTIPSKTCPFDCVYCESGPTTDFTMERKDYYPVSEIIAELERYLSSKPRLDYITFSGAGEPSLYSGIGEIVSFVKKYYPEYKIALITNSALFTNISFWDEVLNIDLVVPSIDAADEMTFHKINRPIEGLKIEEILEGLYQFSKIYKGKIWIEVFIIRGINDSILVLKNIKNWIDKIKPEKIQINSLDRPGSEDWVKKADFNTLVMVREFFGEKAEIVTRRENRADMTALDMDVQGMILKAIGIRPMTLTDLLKMTRLNTIELNRNLCILESEKKIAAVFSGEELFYRCVPSKSSQVISTPLV